MVLECFDIDRLTFLATFNEVHGQPCVRFGIPVASHGRQTFHDLTRATAAAESSHLIGNIELGNFVVLIELQHPAKKHVYEFW